MIQFIQITDDLFLNLGLIVTAEIVPDESDDAEFENYLSLTSLLGNTHDFYGPDADHVLQRLRLLGMETQAASIRLLAAADEAERQVAQLQQIGVQAK